MGSYANPTDIRHYANSLDVAEWSLNHVRSQTHFLVGFISDWGGSGGLEEVLLPAKPNVDNDFVGLSLPYHKNLEI